MPTKAELEERCNELEARCNQSEARCDNLRDNLQAYRVQASYREGERRANEYWQRKIFIFLGLCAVLIVIVFLHLQK